MPRPDSSQHPRGVGVIVTPAPPTGSQPLSEAPYNPWKGVRTPPEEKPVTKIKMRALTYQSVPLGNDKSFVPKDGEFYVFSEQEALARVERQLAERLSPEAKEVDAEGNDGKEGKDLDGPWTLQRSPESYLETWPEGPHADHARAILAKREAEKDLTGDDKKGTITPAGS